MVLNIHNNVWLPAAMGDAKEIKVWPRVRDKQFTFLEDHECAGSMSFFAVRRTEIENQGFTILKYFSDPFKALETVLKTKTLYRLPTYVPLEFHFNPVM